MDHSIEFAKLLNEAVTVPGFISKAYSAFHNYSLGNQMAAMFQCRVRDIEVGPIASFMAWKDKSRSVRKGEKAIVLCQPVTMKGKKEVDGATEEFTFSRFVWRANWFVLSQTEGEAVAAEVASPKWDKAKALTALDIQQVPFAHPNGNVQGYAKARTIAVSEVAQLPHKTTFHEIAHVVLGHTAENMMQDSETTPRDLREVEAESVAYILTSLLDMPGRDESRGYIQNWLDGQVVPEKSAQRIFSAADKILKAGI